MKIYENTTDLFLDGEVWKDINDFPDYQISNYGRVKSFKKCRGINIKILKQVKDKDGYLFVNLFKNKKQKSKKTHILLFETFNDCKLNMNECVHHLDKNPLNNIIDNLQKMSILEHSSFHKPSNETKKLMSQKMSGKNNPNYGKHHSSEYKNRLSEKLRGDNSPLSILKKNQLHQIHKLFRLGFKGNEIAKIYNISKQEVSRIKLGKRWSHIYRIFNKI